MAKILIVEDDLFIRDLVSFRLQDKNHQIIVAANGKDGVHLAQIEQPDLILMDLKLPLLDGWQATKTLKARSDTASIPILAFTAQSYTAVQEKLNPTDYDGYIGKPINFSDLFLQIEGLLINTKIIA